MFKTVRAACMGLALSLGQVQGANADTYLAQAHSKLAIHDAAVRWGGYYWRQLEQYMDCIADRESTFVPWAQGTMGEQGLFQFLPPLWNEWATQLDQTKGMNNAWSAADAAANAIVHGYSYKWTTTYYCGYW